MGEKLFRLALHFLLIGYIASAFGPAEFGLYNLCLSM